MSNFHLEIRIISRGNESSVVQIANYISGVKLYDTYFNKTYYSKRNDVLFLQIFLPDNVPPKFNHLQKLCNEIDSAEKRYDAQTARQFIGSLPNELPFGEQKQIVVEYINHNFVASGLCAIAAIHEGKNEFDPKKNNPHVHILVSTRRIEPDGFNKIKDREHNKKKYIRIWREQWAQVQNRAYERNGYDIRVSHESLEVHARQHQIELERIHSNELSR